MTVTEGFNTGVQWFDEDFDAPPPPPAAPEPEIIEPVFTADELETARRDAAFAAREAALAEAETNGKATARRALTSIADQIAAMRDEAAAVAEETAEAIARLLLDCFATAFPALSRRHGADETAAVLRAILPALRQEPKIAVRVSPHVIDAIKADIDAIDPDLIARVRLVPTDAMAPEDIRIDWEHGTAIRDTTALWRRIEDVLAPAGLLSPKQSTREKALAD